MSDKKPRPFSIDCSSGGKTDQSFANQSDINWIVNMHKKQGTFPIFQNNDAYYADVSNIPTFEEAFNIVNEAYASFMELPSVIRSDMNNDPSKLVSYVSDPNNRDLLEKHGVIKIKRSESPTVEPVASSDKGGEEA